MLCKDARIRLSANFGFGHGDSIINVEISCAHLTVGCIYGIHMPIEFPLFVPCGYMHTARPVHDQFAAKPPSWFAFVHIETGAATSPDQFSFGPHRALSACKCSVLRTANEHAAQVRSRNCRMESMRRKNASKAIRKQKVKEATKPAKIAMF